MAGATRADVWKLLTHIQDDLRQTQTKLVELRSMLSAGALERSPDNEAKCHICGITHNTVERVAEHLRNVHDLQAEVVAGQIIIKNAA